MKDPVFNSSLAKQMQNFVTLRRLSGSDYTTQNVILSLFDRFLVGERFRCKYLTRIIYERYVASLAHLHPRYRSNQCSVIRQFSIYLSRHEPRTYIPEPVSAGKSQDDWRAYIYTEQEIRQLLQAAANLQHGWLRSHMYRALIGLLYTTGIRIGEALALNIEDFYPDTMRLYVRNGKFRKARWVPLSRSTSAVLEEYIVLRQQVAVKASSPSALFISAERQRLSYDAARVTFNHLLEQCDIRRTQKHGPRIHDIRHTFAVHRLLEWYRDGHDINARLPALATYMGHVWISSTQVYIQATPELYELANERFHGYVHANKIIQGIDS